MLNVNKKKHTHTHTHTQRERESMKKKTLDCGVIETFLTCEILDFPVVQLILSLFRDIMQH